MLLDKVTDSSNSVVQERYITLSVHKKNVEEARAFFDRTVHDASSRLNHMDSHCEEMDAADRLHILHDFYRVGEESEFRFDLRENMKNGRSFKDAICPDSSGAFASARGEPLRRLTCVTAAVSTSQSTAASSFPCTAHSAA